MALSQLQTITATDGAGTNCFVRAVVALALIPQPWRSERLQPCPKSSRRLRLQEWTAAGLVPEGVAATAVAAAYRRRFGVSPRRDPRHRSYRCYSLRELGQALMELGLVAQPPAGWESAADPTKPDPYNPEP